MGQEKTTTVVNQTTTPKATPEEARLNQLEIARQEQLFKPTVGLQQIGLDVASKLLGGSTNLPGFYGGIAQGISPQYMTDVGDISPTGYNLQPENYLLTEPIISALSQKAIRDIMPKFQTSGILDSGVAADIAQRTAADIRTQAENQNLQTALGIGQWNLGNQLAIEEANRARKLGVQEFNLNTEMSRQGYNLSNLFNLLNLGVGGQAQVQQPILQYANILSQRLQGLRPVTTAGTTTQTGNFWAGPIGQGIGRGIGQAIGSIPTMMMMGAGI